MLAREQSEAGDKEHVLNSLGTAATAIRAKLGESRSSIEQLNRPLEQATTPSLEALQYYTVRYTELNQGRFLAAVAPLKRATELDPNFAKAYNFLAVASYNAGDLEQSAEYDKKAFALIDRVSESERDYISAGYYYDGTGELDKAVDALRLGSRMYPRDPGFHLELSTINMDRGRFEDALVEAQEAARLQARNESPYRWELSAYMRLGQMTKASDVAKQARALGFDGARLHSRFLEMAFINDDVAAAQHEIEWYAGRPEEYLSFGLRAAKADSLGQREKARDLYRRAADTARRQGLSGAASDFAASDSVAEALVGDCRTVRRAARATLALALCGNSCSN